MKLYISIRKTGCLFLLLLFAFTSCEKDMVYHRYQPIPFEGWNRKDTLIYVLPGGLTGKTYRLEMGIRHNETYPYRDLWIEIYHLLIPYGTHERLHLYLADETGNWKGKGNAGSLYQYTASGFTLNLQPGDSILQIVHIMETDLLEGITDVGIRLSLPGGVNAQKNEEKNRKAP